MIQKGSNLFCNVQKRQSGRELQISMPDVRGVADQDTKLRTRLLERYRGLLQVTEGAGSMPVQERTSIRCGRTKPDLDGRMILILAGIATAVELVQEVNRCQWTQTAQDSNFLHRFATNIYGKRNNWTRLRQALPILRRATRRPCTLAGMLVKQGPLAFMKRGSWASSLTVNHGDESCAMRRSPVSASPRNQAWL